MSLRDLARELYRAQRKVTKLERLLLPATPGLQADDGIPVRRVSQEEADRLLALIAEARAEVLQLRRILDGHKNTETAPRRF